MDEIEDVSEKSGRQKKDILNWMEPTYPSLEEGEGRAIEIKLPEQEKLKRMTIFEEGKKVDLPIFQLWDKSQESQTIDKNYTVENATSELYLSPRPDSFEVHVYRLNYFPTTEDVIHFKNQVKYNENKKN